MDAPHDRIGFRLGRHSGNVLFRPPNGLEKGTLYRRRPASGGHPSAVADGKHRYARCAGLGDWLGWDGAPCGMEGRAEMAARHGGCTRTRTGGDRTTPFGAASAFGGLLPVGEHETTRDTTSDPSVTMALGSCRNRWLS